jgi:hypothetical protein
MYTKNNSVMKKIKLLLLLFSHLCNLVWFQEMKSKYQASLVRHIEHEKVRNNKAGKKYEALFTPNDCHSHLYKIFYQDYRK